MPKLSAPTRREFMKKRLLIVACVMALFACLLSISVSAEGATSNEFGTLTTYEGVATPSTIDTTSRVVLVASDGTYYTFPAYYILEDNSYFTWKQNADVTATLGYSQSSAQNDFRPYVIRMEIPEGIVDMNSTYRGGAMVFEDAKKMIEVTLPTTLTKLGGYVFNRCYELVTINGMEGFMSRVQLLGRLAFNGTKWGEGFDLVIPSWITEVPESCFQGTKIRSVTFNEGLVTLGPRSFQSCTNLTAIELPASLEALKNHVFASCSNLASIDTSKCTRLSEIGEYCFESSKLTSFDFTPFVKVIKGAARGWFNRCPLVEAKGFELADGITEIGANLFYNCPLPEIKLPRNITSIGDYAFFNHKSTQTELRIPNKVASIGNHAFARNGKGGSDGLKIYLGASVTSISNDYVFEHWTYKEMYIPAGVTSIPKGFCNDTLQSGAVYFYTGAQNGLTINETHNSAMLNAEWIAVDSFNGASNEKNYIVYGYNPCDAFYYGYDFDENTANCTNGETCSRCGRTGESFNPYKTHNTVESLILPSFTEAGTYECDCINDGCTAGDIAKKTVPALFTAKGYSTNAEKTAINGGYTVNKETLELYKKINGSLTYGIVIANAEKFDGKSFFNESNKVNTTKALQVEINNEYSNFDCSINFGATSNSDLKLIICAYVIDGDNVTFIQAESGEAVDSTLVTGGSFKSVTLNYVAALPTSKEEEIA